MGACLAVICRVTSSGTDRGGSAQHSPVLHETSRLSGSASHCCPRFHTTAYPAPFCCPIVLPQAHICMCGLSAELLMFQC